MLGTTVILALNEIRRHLLRSFLTVLGIVIGVAAVVMMVTLGRGATQAVQDEVAGLGSNLIYVVPSQGVGRGVGSIRPPNFKQADVDAIATQIAGVVAAAPQESAGRTAVREGRNWTTTITGTTTDFFRIQKWEPQAGQIFTKADEQAGRAVCLLGQTVKENLYGPEEAVGTRLRLGDVSCTVAAVMKKRGGGANVGSDPDDSIVMPIKAVQRRLTGSRDIGLIVVGVDARYDSTNVQDAVIALLRERRGFAPTGDKDFRTFGTEEFSQSVGNITGILTAFMGAVGGVSLLVGGIGIMNIMLVSVIERTREIGIRLAIGAVAREVLLQFLVEAVVLSCIGGLIGLLLALLGGLALAPALGVPFLFDWKLNLGAFLFSALIGVVFGYFPARRAAALNPIDALRHE